MYHGDIAELTVDGCMDMAGLSGPGERDMLDESPQCQGFSTAGKRRMKDGRNQLFREYVRLPRGLQPKVLVMEKVGGIVREDEVDLRRDNARAESFELLRIGAADKRHLYSVPLLFMKSIAAHIRRNFFK